MKTLTLLFALALLLFGCAGNTDSTPSDEAITWTPEGGLEVELETPVGPGAVIELGQSFRGPASMRLEPVTIDGGPLAGVRSDHSSDPDGLGRIVLSFTAAGELAAGTVIATRAVSTADGSGIRPLRASFSVDGIERARRQW